MGTSELIILIGALAGGYVTGLTGFGTGLTALVFWLQVVPPIIAAPMVVICSIIGQLQTLKTIWKHIVWHQVAPFIAGGLIGVPLGTLILPYISLETFKLLVGGLLISYSAVMLLRRSTPIITWGGRTMDAVVGLSGGVLGGLAGLSGPLPTIWGSLKGWGKHQKRGLFQSFNLSILLFAAASQAFSGYITPEVGRWIIFALPGTLAGAWLGRKTYDKLGDHRFDQIVLGLLMLAGISILL
jgi:uncharacterized protein